MSPAQSALHSVSVAGVIVDTSANNVLLIKRRDNGRWEPPGGVLELSESIDVGLRRELGEEAGVEVEVESLTGVYKNVPLGIVALVFRCRLANGSAPAEESEEASEVRWHPIASIRTLMPSAYAVRVLDALADRPTVRSHDGEHCID